MEQPRPSWNMLRRLSAFSASLVLLASLMGCVPQTATNPPPGTATTDQAGWIGLNLRYLQIDPNVPAGGAEPGAWIAAVVTGGPAEKAGLKEGDLIVSADGAPTRTAEELASAVGRNRPGTTLRLSYVRAGQRAEVDVKLAERPPANDPRFAEAEVHARNNVAWLGVMWRDIEFDPTAANGGASAGVRIDTLFPGGPAEVAELHEGDVIVTMSGKSTQANVAAAQIIKTAAPGSIFSLDFIRAGSRQTTVVKTKLYPGDGMAKALLNERLRAERQSARDAETGGDFASSFIADVKAYRTLYQEVTSRWLDYDAADPQIDALVAHMATLSPKLPNRPAVSAEALRQNRRARALLDSATSDEDYDKVYQAFANALFEAPWLADLWLNAGLVVEKGGYPEAAKRDLQRYLVLNPGAPDAEAVRQRMAALDVAAEERKPWLRYTGTVTYDNGSSELVALRGRTLTVSLAGGAIPGSTNKPGDLIFRGTIHGRQFEGKGIVRPADPNAIRCLSSQIEQDAEGTIEADGLFVVREKGVTFDNASCAHTAETWDIVRRYRARPNP